jgi:DNA-binding SARP family transcriptional activator
VLVDDRLIDSGAWGSARPRELLTFLLLHPEGSTKEQVGLALWPDASTAQLRNSFHVTTYRLRKALGAADWIVLTGERYTVNRALLQDFDVSLFEREVATARRDLASGVEGADASLETALARYRGDLLDGEPVGDWVEAHRARLQRVYVDALMDLGAVHEAGQRDERAADVYHRVMRRDPLHEQAAMALMRALARLGDQSQAARVFQRFHERLRRDLQVAPSRETVALAERIRHGGTA